MKEMMKRIIYILCACMMITGCSEQVGQPEKDEQVIVDEEVTVDKESENIDLPIAKALEINNDLENNFKPEYLSMEAFQTLEIESITFALTDSNESYEWVITDKNAFDELKGWAKDAEFTAQAIMPGKQFAIQIKTMEGEMLNLVGVRDYIVVNGKAIKCNTNKYLADIMSKYAKDKYRVETFNVESKYKSGNWYVVERMQMQNNVEINNTQETQKVILPISSIYNIKETDISAGVKYAFFPYILKTDEFQSIDIESIVIVSKDNNQYIEWVVRNPEAFDIFKKWSLEVTTKEAPVHEETDYIVQVNVKDADGVVVFGGSGNSVLDSNGDYWYFSESIISLLKPFMENEQSVQKPALNVLINRAPNYLNNIKNASVVSYYDHFDAEGVRQELGTKGDEWKDALSMVFYLEDFDEDNPIQDWTKISTGIAAQEIYVGYEVYGGLRNAWNQTHEFTIPDYAKGGVPFTATLVPEEFVIEKGKEYFGDGFTLEHIPEGKHQSNISYVKPDQLFLVRTPYGGIGYHSTNIFKIIHLEEKDNQRTYRGLLYFSQSLDTATNDNNETFDSIADNKDKFRYVEISMEKIDEGIRINSFKTLHDPNNGLYDETAWSDWDYIPEFNEITEVIDSVEMNHRTFDDILKDYQNLQVAKIEYDVFDSKGIGYSYSIESQEDIEFVMEYFRKASLGYTLKDALYGLNMHHGKKPRTGVYSDYVVTLIDVSGQKYIFELYEDSTFGQMISLNFSDMRIQNYGPSIAYALSLKGKYLAKPDIYYLDHGAEEKQFTTNLEECVAQLNESGDLETLLENPLLPSILLNKKENLTIESEKEEIDLLLDNMSIEPGRYQYGSTCSIYNEDGTTKKCSGYYATKSANIYLYAYSYDENNKLFRYYVVDNQFGHSWDYDDASQALREFRYSPEKYGVIKIDENSSITILQNIPYTTVDVSQIRGIFNNNRQISGGITLSSESGFKSILSQIMVDLEIRNYTYVDNNEYYSILPVENTYGEFGSNKLMIRKSDGRFMTDQTLSGILLGTTFEEFIEPEIIENGYQVCKGENQEGICAWVPVITEDDQLAGSDMHTTSFYINEEEIYVDIPVYRDGWLIDKLTVQVK